MRLGGRSFFLVAASIALLVLPSAYLLMAERPSAAADPVQLLTEYLKAVYARDFGQAYRFISSADRKLKEERTYIRERGPFSGFTLKAAQKLASFIEATPVAQKRTESHARIKLRLKLPDADRLSTVLFDWDEDRLNSLPAREQMALLQRLEQWKREGKIDVLDGYEEFELVREGGRWRVFLNWAAGVRVSFDTVVPSSLSLEAKPVQREVIVPRGEPFNVSFKVRNLSNREVSARIAHLVEPKDMAGYLELIQCSLLFPIRLQPEKEEEYSSTYLLRGDLPEGVRRFKVTYEFKMEDQ